MGIVRGSKLNPGTAHASVPSTTVQPATIQVSSVIDIFQGVSLCAHFAVSSASCCCLKTSTIVLLLTSQRAIKKEQTWVVSQIVTTSQRMQSSAAAWVQQPQDDGACSTSSSVGSFEGTSAATAETVLVRTAADALGSAPQTPVPGGSSISSSGPAIVPLTEAMLLDQMQLQQQLDDLLHEMEQLLLREHDQHFMLLWSCAKMPGSLKVFMEVRPRE